MGKTTPQLEEILLETRVRNKEDEFFKYGRFDDETGEQKWFDDRKEKIQILNDADLICCTTIGSGSVFFDAMKFGALLIDEAAPATELSALVPLVLRGAQQFVLVGDHCQLPPSIASFEAEVRGLSLSLFSR